MNDMESRIGKEKASLLDRLAEELGMELLSDLHFLRSRQRKCLLNLLERIPPEAYPLKQWNDALNYLAKLPPEETAERARIILRAALEKDECPSQEK